MSIPRQMLAGLLLLTSVLELLLFLGAPADGATPRICDEKEKQALGTRNEPDPLPHGAVARLGTTRLRRLGLPWDSCIDFSPKGDIVAVSGGSLVRAWDTATGKELPPLFQAPLKANGDRL